MDLTGDVRLVASVSVWAEWPWTKRSDRFVDDWDCSDERGSTSDRDGHERREVWIEHSAER